MRVPHALRPLSLELGSQLHADGSCTIKQGNTHVLCAANLMPGVPDDAKGGGAVTGWVTAEFGVLPSATHRRTDRENLGGRQQSRTVEVQRLLTHSLRQAVDLSLLGERTLQIDCDVINADGGSRSTALNGAWVALALALRKHGLEAALRRQVAALSMGVVEEGHGRRGMLVDLDYAEEEAVAIHCYLVASRAMEGGEVEIVDFQAAGDGRPFPRSECAALLEMGLRGCEKLMEIQAQRWEFFQ